MARLASFMISAITLLATGAAQAAPLNIVALGASNTFGSGQGRTAGGVAENEAYPAQLEALLRARGVDAHVMNAGVPGDTTAGMYARLSSAVPQGTQIVILQPGGNDARRGVGADSRANVSRIERDLRARHIKVVVLDRVLAIAPQSTHDPDGQHLDAAGQRALAVYLLPRVLSAIRR